MKTRFMQSPFLSVCVQSSDKFEGVNQFQQSLRENNIYTNFKKRDNQAKETQGSNIFSQNKTSQPVSKFQQISISESGSPHVAAKIPHRRRC